MSKMIGAHLPPHRTPAGFIPKKPLAHETSIYNTQFRRELFRSADKIINRQPRPRP